MNQHVLSRFLPMFLATVCCGLAAAGCGEEASDAPAAPEEGAGGEAGEGGSSGQGGTTAQGGSAGQPEVGGASGKGGSNAGGSAGTGGKGGTGGSSGKGGAGGSGGVAGTGGSGGVCTPGTNAIQGVFANDVSPIEFSQANVSLTHKQDIDPVEGGCVTRVQIDLQAGAGCALSLVATTPYAWQGGLTIDSISFTADSFCPGFPDAKEGTYAGTDGLTVAQVVPQAQAVDDTTASKTTLQTSMAVKLEGLLRRQSDQQPLAITPTQITVTGCFPSTGSTNASCPCKPTCPLGCTPTGEPCDHCASTDQKCKGGTLYTCNATGTDFEASATCQYGCDAGGLKCQPPPHDAAVVNFAPRLHRIYHQSLNYFTSWYDANFSILNAGTQQLQECIDYKIYTNAATLPSTPPDPYKDFEGQVCVNLAPGAKWDQVISMTYANPSSASDTGTGWVVLSIADDNASNNIASATWSVYTETVWE